MALARGRDRRRSALCGAWKETIVPVCEGPEGIDISPDGREAWV
jgi:hypothetical protein